MTLFKTMFAVKRNSVIKKDHFLHIKSAKKHCSHVIAKPNFQKHRQLFTLPLQRERELSDSWFVRGRVMDVFESERC